MMIKVNIVVVITVIASLSTIFVLVHGDGCYRGFLCPPEEAMADCNDDCRNDHGSLYGFCVNNTRFPNDYHCYCGPLVDRRRPNPVSTQCKDELDYRYDELCRVACQCAHGAMNGNCNYKTRSCECTGYQVRNPGGRNRQCPYKTFDDFKKFVNELDVGIHI